MTNIATIGFSPRLTRALQRANIHTLGTLQSKSLVELAELQGVGEVALLEIVRVGFVDRDVELRRGDHVCPQPSSKVRARVNRVWGTLIMTTKFQRATAS
jgi:DNA-directed RNA polymerase alpha subunit